VEWQLQVKAGSTAAHKQKLFNTAVAFTHRRADTLGFLAG
jgi:hypothetical protein